MKKRTLPLSLLIGATLTLPSLAMAAPADTAQANVQTAQADMEAAQANIQTAQADMQATSVNDGMETEATSPNVEQGANQSSPFVINETQTISRASVNKVSNPANAQQAMPTTMQAQQDMQVQQDMQAQQDMQLQVEPQGMQDSQEDMLQEEQEADMMDQ